MNLDNNFSYYFYLNQTEINPPSPTPDSCQYPRMRIRFSFLLILVGLAAVTAETAYAFVCPALEGGANRAMKGWQVPGMAVAVVRDGKTAYRKTFGVADVETARPVTEETLFGIGSITKSMTALGFAIADKNRALPLNTPVQSALPYFPAAITIRHLLSHTSGWPRHDALWYLNVYDHQALPERLARLPRFAHPGTAFQYNNVPFAAVGAFLTKSTGASWHEWIRSVVLHPAGMTSAITRFSVFRNSDLRATPYFPAREGRITLELRDTDPVSPAAGVYADIRDMTRYTALLASGGLQDGLRVIPAKAIAGLWPSVSSRYGLGVRTGSWQGRKLAFHPGFIDGYGARISILPGENAGVVVLTNMSGETPVARIVSQFALDCLTKAPATDWVARFGNRRPPPKPEPTLPQAEPLDRDVAAYAGRFVHPAYGPLTFHPVGNSLKGSFHGRTFDLTYAGKDHWQLDETHWPLRRGLRFSFSGLKGSRFNSVSAPLADGPSYRHKAGPLAFKRMILPSPADKPD